MHLTHLVIHAILCILHVVLHVKAREVQSEMLTKIPSCWKSVKAQSTFITINREKLRVVPGMAFNNLIYNIYI